MLPFGPAASVPMGAAPPAPVRLLKRHPVPVALGILTLVIGATWWVGRQQERRYLARVSVDSVRSDPEIRWNPKVKRWQNARGKFVKPPPGAKGGPGSRRRPVRLLV